MGMSHFNWNLSLYYTHPLLWGLILDWKIEDSWRLKACSLYNLSLSSKFKHKFDTTYTQSSVKYTIIISCSSQTHFRPLPVQTQGMQLLKLFIQIYYINSHQQYENVTIEVSHSSMFKYHNGLSIINSYNTHKTQKTAGAVILQLALKLQKGNNFSVIPI